ncbi:WD domain-containing protein [Colletotrichum graminicola M1.001]|uniref:WD domain-containing protein n=1 Tax=Colletotrichum graminicola (strain M1.001 / M2 / FGSC 10212) TaxID=645133 RepID=E3QLI9_COLGM|nr:WD domain-containing protein [Colletotrichum graminicola M1.001]EFQ31727.1 WD domain-containing protein [Colletotrichum graminicola M1.001]
MQLSPESPELTELARDALRFIRANRAGIELSLLQVYTSALIFSPKLSTIRMLFGDEEPHRITTKPAVEDNWSACLQTLEGHASGVSSVVFCSNSMQLVSGSWDRTVKVWDIATGQCIQTLLGHTNEVYSVALSSDSKYLASADKTIKIWDLATSQRLQTHKHHISAFASVTFSGDNTQLVSTSDDGTVQIWDSTGWYFGSLKGHTKATTLGSLLGNNTKVASYSDGSSAKIWDKATGRCLKTLEGHRGRVTSISITGRCLQTRKDQRDRRPSYSSVDSILLASASVDKTIKVWDIATGQCLHTLHGHKKYSGAVAFSSDGTQLASISRDGTARIWDVATGKCLQTLGHDGWPCSVAFSNNGTQPALSSGDTIMIWDISTGQSRCTIRTADLGYFSQIFFSETDLQLYADKGAIDLRPGTGPTSRPRANAVEVVTFCGYAFSHDNVWITRDSENVLWLPPEYRPRCTTVSGSTMAPGCDGGGLIVLGFSEDDPIL